MILFLEVSDIEYVGINGLNYDFLIEERKKHDAYNSCSILRRLRTLTSSSGNTIQPNVASHLVSYLTNNDENNQHFILQRENRWKTSRRLMAESLANHNYEKSQQLHRKKRTKDILPQSGYCI